MCCILLALLLYLLLFFFLVPSLTLQLTRTPQLSSFITGLTPLADPQKLRNFLCLERWEKQRYAVRYLLVSHLHVNFQSTVADNRKLCVSVPSSVPPKSQKRRHIKIVVMYCLVRITSKVHLCTQIGWNPNLKRKKRN